MNKCKGCGYAIITKKWRPICGFKDLFEYIQDTYYAPDNIFNIDINNFGCIFWESKKGFQESKRHLPFWMNKEEYEKERIR